jgi:hypothetical protein
MSDDLKVIEDGKSIFVDLYYNDMHGLKLSLFQIE